MSLSILIVEDKRLTAEAIAAYVRELGYSVGGITDSGEQALRIIQNRNIDLAILDIDINGAYDGIQTSAKIYEIEPMPFIYLTELEEARRIDRAIETRPGAFVSKPFTKHDLSTALKVAQNNFIMPNQGVDGEKKHFFCKKNDKNIRIRIDNIFYLKAQGARTAIYTPDIDTPDGKHAVAHRLRVCLSKLPQKTFCRIHRSFAVNLYKVDAFDRTHVFIGDFPIPLGGRNYREDFLSRIQSL